jgi:hypothetical protein
MHGSEWRRKLDDGIERKYYPLDEGAAEEGKVLLWVLGIACSAALVAFLYIVVLLWRV